MKGFGKARHLRFCAVLLHAHKQLMAVPPDGSCFVHACREALRKRNVSTDAVKALQAFIKLFLDAETVDSADGLQRLLLDEPGQEKYVDAVKLYEKQLMEMFEQRVQHVLAVDYSLTGNDVKLWA
eukprot:2547670-Rhodomonas_salina.1